MKKFLRVLTVFLATLFIFTAASCKEEPKEFAGTAQDLVNLINLKQDHQTVASDFTVPGTVTQDETTVEVLWTSNNTEALTFSKTEGSDPLTWKAEIHKSEKEDLTATFKASVTYKDVTASKNFKIRIARHVRPEENLENLYLGVYEDDQEATFKGWVAWMSEEAEFKGDTQRNMYIYDESKLGFVYAYQMKIDPEFSKTVKVGDPIIATGKVSEYGVRQIKHGSLVQDKKGTHLDEIPVTDITTDFIVNDEKTMLMHSSKLVTLSNVTTTKVAESIKPARPDKKEPFNTTTILEGTVMGQEISVVANKDYIDLATAEAALANAKKVAGKHFAVTGFVSAFAGKPQIILVKPDTIVESTELAVNDTVKLATSLNEAAELVSDKFVKVQEVALLAAGKTYNNVTLTYALEEASTVFEVANGKLVVKEALEDSDAKLVITATLGETTITKTVKICAKTVAEKLVHPVVVTTPQVDTEYVLYLEHGKLDKNLYFAGKMAGFYLDTVENPNDATMVKLEAKGEGYALYFMDGTTKNYVNVESRTNKDGSINHAKSSLSIGTESKTVYLFNAEAQTLVAQGQEGNQFFFGTKADGTFATFGGENLNDLSKNFVAKLATLEEGEAPKPSEKLDVTKDYQLSLNHTGLNKVLYFAGKMGGYNNYYLATTEAEASATTVKVEAKGNGYALYFMNGEAKMYVNVTPREGQAGKASLSIDAESKTNYVYNSELKTLVAVVGDNQFVFGTASNKTYDTFGTENVADLSKSLVVTLDVKVSGGETPEPTPVEKIEFTGVIIMSSFAKGYVTVQAADGKATTLMPNKEIFTEEKWNATFVVGKEIVAKGEAGDKDGLNILTVVAEADVTVKGDKALPEALDITEIVKTSTDLKADLLANQSRLVVVKNATFKGGKLYVGEKYIKYYVDGAICTKAHELVENGVYTITGMLNWYHSPQVTPITPNAVVVVSEPVLEEFNADATITPKTQGTANETDNFAANFAGAEGFVIKFLANDCDNKQTNNLPAIKSTEIRLYGKKADLAKGTQMNVSIEGKTIAKVRLTFTGGAINVNGQECLTATVLTLTDPVSVLEIVSMGTSQAKLKKIEIAYAK